MDQLRWQVARGAGVALRLQSLLRFAGLPLVETTIRAGALARLQLLAAPALVRADATVVPLERKDAALLALLAFDGPTSRSRAAALLWPDADADKARNSLRQRLFRLRRAAGTELIEPDESLRLADRVEHNLVSPMQQLASDPTAAAGDLLGTCVYEDCPELEDWVRIARERWRAMRSDALAELAAKREADGQIALALQYGERLLADDPLREHAHRQLMRLHYLRGDRAAALAAFDRCLELLKRELGTTPGNETLELGALIESSGVLSSPAIVAKPVSVLRPPKLVGRDAEWGELEVAWHQQRLALVCGEPGIGKTRLLGDFVARHDGAIIVGARPGDERVPFALLARLLRAVTQRHTPILEDWARAELSRLLPELGAAPETKLQLVRLQRAVVHALLVASNAGLTGCAIDDLHFADDASVESLLALIAGKEADMRWLVGVRAAEMSRRLLEWLERTEPNEVARIELGPLDVQAIEALLISLVLPDFDARAWAEPLARHTGGNPLFILETLSAALTQDATALRGGVALLPAPSSVGQLIERRLHKLSRDALRLARVAALAGQDFSVGLAACVLSAHPLDLAEAWHELEVAQIIRADRDGSAFAHDLILETTLRTVPHAIARVMHKDIAEFLEAHGAQPARIAGHYYEAEQWSKAGAHYRIAADRARYIAFGANAAELYQRAADSSEKAGQRTERLEALNWHGICLHFMKRFPEYAAVAQKMSSLAVTPREQLWTLIALAKSRFEITHDDESIRLMRAARLLARELGDTPSDCSLAEWEALALSFLGRQQEALEVGKTLRAFIEANPQDTEMAMRRRQYAYLLEMDNQFEQAIDFADSAIVRARADGNLGLVSETLVIRGACLYNLGQVDAAIDEYHAARRLQIEGAGGTMAWTTYDIMLGRYLQEAARYREAHQILANVLEGHASADDWVSAQCAATLAHCFITLGQTARARRLLGSAPPADSVARIGWLHAKVRLARAENKPARALIDEMAELAVVSPRAERLTWQVQIELARELDAAEAVALAQQVVDESRAKRTYSAYLPAKAMLVDGLRRAGRHDESTRTARGLTDELATRAAIGLYPAEYWWLIFQAFSAAGDHVDATTSLASAVDWINDVALPNIPDEYSDSFLNRNPVNRAILTTASRRR